MVMKEEEYAERRVVPNAADGEDSLNLTLPMDLSFVGDDAFHIDDFSNEDIAAPITTPSLSSSSTTTDSAFYSSFLPHEDFTIICPSYPDTTAGLQWPPDFGEESPLPIMSTTDGASSVKLEKMKAEDDEESNIMPMVPAISEMERLREVPSKARSKRPRTSADTPPKAWSSSSPTMPAEGEVEVQVKEWKDDVRGAGERRSQQPRRCTHCLVQRTPQWRTGPLGPKTLCNACGVRYKSGRLYPEYRPAKSPTFVRYLHSNSHKKVLELRTNFSADDTSDQEDLNTIVINNINSHRLDLPQTNTCSPLKLTLKFPPPSSSFLTQP